ncbi:SDR family NAD(P)-dependent oxidoreductase [Acidihalobacter aeolianus]|uniref:SDR family NAD(P)-dependent oxidoreductase n=1 Tax=Acidihalobacter aeolianus TaxID=2792603 RepID=UPI0009F345ED|nr:3-oxoacyl-ACP reductase family protein [Acidihalobacter aeolianus]
MQIDLSGRTALVTGAASGIGRATALALAEAGARVAVNHLDRAAEADEVVDRLRALGARAIACEADVSDGAQVGAMIDKVVAALDGIDILVNNAGIILERPFLDMDEADWDRVLGTDLKSVFLCCRAALPDMLARGGGCIVNVASELGYLGRAGYAAYTSAKAGVIGLTRSLAREFAPTIRVNAVAPGPVATAMLDPSLMSPEVIARETDIPLGRLGQPEEIAASVVFLASPLASFYCGQTLGPNGGALMT